jgi:hypothetical protein
MYRTANDHARRSAADACLSPAPGSRLLAPLLLALVSLGMPLAAQTGTAGNQPQPAARAPIASNPVIDITGIVGQVQIAAGQGMSYLEVKQGSQIMKVYLGPMFYLIAQDFSPKTGQEVAVKGYKQTDSVIAIQITLTKEQKTLKLRDENGWPLWRGGPWRGGRGRMMGGPPAPSK